MAELIFITGGTRSGKSGYAQRRAEAHPGPLLYVATAAAGDAEMTARIARHRTAREGRWETLEEPLALGERLPAAAAGKGAVLIDCLTLWLTNLFFQHREEPAPVLAAASALVESLPRIAAPVYLVSNELGSGVVPENRLARRFRDLAGEVNQLLAAAANEAWLVVAGLPLRLK
jgi:adenosylcobinamide kinase / adenosylcobinamide-phosphate guanylyltransferase